MQNYMKSVLLIGVVYALFGIFLQAILASRYRCCRKYC